MWASDYAGIDSGIHVNYSFEYVAAGEYAGKHLLSSLIDPSKNGEPEITHK